MNKRTKIILIAVGVAVAAYLAYRWYRNRQAGSNQSPTGGLGTNLNSVAPELVGGSAGPAVGPALSAPININLTEQVAPPPEPPETEMEGTNASSTNALKRQSSTARNFGSQPAKIAAMHNIINPGESIPGGVVGQPQPVAKSGIKDDSNESEPGSRFTEPEEMEK